MQKRYIAVYIAVVLVVLSFASSFFVRPHPPDVVLVTEQQELPDPNAHYSIESGLSERVSKSYGLALVLVISEFSRKNAVALEALRSWAHDNFQRDPGFLHAVEVKPTQKVHFSVIDTFCYSLFSQPRFLLEDLTLHFLKQQIAEYHKTKAYESFRADYFDSFGLDHESALMLARYQSERAQQAVGVLLSGLFWIFAVLVGIVSFFRYKVGLRSTRPQRLIALFWFSLSLFYLIVSWSQNDVSVLVSSFFCAVIGLYLRRPVAVSLADDKGLSFRLLTFAPRVCHVILWATVTLVAVQILTWLHSGTLHQPDPITLLISASFGDFVHDHMNAKRYLMRFLGAGWLLFSLWTLWSVIGSSNENLDEGLAPLKDSLP